MAMNKRCRKDGEFEENRKQVGDLKSVKQIRRVKKEKKTKRGEQCQVPT